MKRLVLVPAGWPCVFSEAPAGLFVTLDERRSVGLLTEYSNDAGRIAYVAASGEAWGVNDVRSGAVLVQPVESRWEDVEE